MNTIAVLQSDLQETTLRTRSRLADRVAGAPILRRTVQQLVKAREIRQIVVLAPENQVSACRDILSGLSVLVQGVCSPPPPWSSLMRASRKWSLDGWRGGVGGSTVFDEYTDCRLLAGLLEIVPADAILSVPAAAPLIDPDLADQMVAHREKHKDTARMTFTTAVPGLAGIVLDADLVRELAASGTPISWLFTYKPDDPRKDLIFQPACMDIPAPLRFATGRLIADTDRTFTRINRMLEKQETWTLAGIGEFLLEQDERGTELFPREVEIELTTDDPYPDSHLVSRGPRLGRTGNLELSTLTSIASELIQRDDVLCVLGGFGDPLRHRRFHEALDILRPRAAVTRPPRSASCDRGVFGLCVRTSAVDLTPPICEALITHQVDVLQVSLDAWTQATYERVKGIPANDSRLFSQVLANIEFLGKLQKEKQSPVPIVVPDMIKARQNAHEMDEFFDGWLRRQGAASITGYSDHAGQLPDHSVIDMRPPTRLPCRRLRTRCLIRSDGQVTLCDQDFRGSHKIGRLGESETTLSQVWQSPAFEGTRHDHLAARYDTLPLCAACTQWHQP